MKKGFTILMGLLCLAMYAMPQQKQLDKIIAVQYNRTPLSLVLEDLQKRTKMNFSYMNNEAMMQQTVTLNVRDKTVREVYNMIFKPLHIRYEEVGSTIVLKPEIRNIQPVKPVSKMITLSGFVREKNTLETMPGATVYISALRAGAVTNNYGFYSITIPAGVYLVDYTSVGFNKTSETLTLHQSLQHDAFVQQSDAMQEVIVSSKKDVTVSQDVRMSTIDIPIASVKRLPSIGGEKDVFKILQLYPGVQRGVEGTSGFYVRGGTADQNLVVLDEAPVYNASHAFGLFSIFNGDAIKSAELIKGGFPARYGERLSSILVMNMKEGNKERFAGEVGIGLIASRFTLEGPIQKGKSSFLVSGRRTYGDIFVQPFLEKGTNAGYFFYDLNAKVNTELDKNNHFYLSAYLGRDNLYDTRKGNGYKTKNNFGWGNQTLTFRWNHVFSKKLFGNASFIYSNYRLKTTDSDDFGGEKSASSYSSQISDLGFKYDLDYSPHYSHALRIGVRTVAHRFTPSAVKNTGNRDYQNSSQGETLNSWENNLYAEDTWTASGRVSVNGGIRASTFSTEGTTYIRAEPRVSTRVLLTNTLSVKGSYSRMNQYLNLLSNTNIGIPTDLWVPSTKNLAPQRSTQVAFGLAKDIDDQKYAVTLEGYYKRMYDLISYKEGASYINIVIGDRTEVPKSASWQDKITTGQGKSYGAELLLEKKKGRLTGWIGYTLSWTRFQFKDINGGDPYRPMHDRRHNGSVVGMYDLSKRVKLSFSWVYMSGSPITIMKSNYTTLIYGPMNALNPDFNTSSTPFVTNMTDYSKKGSFITDAYHRLDVGIQFIKQKKHGVRTWDISIYNAYNRFNPFYYGYDQELDRDRQTIQTQLKKYSYSPIIPSITYSYKF